jgi:tRNA (guanosine-2'-O-)-methyltransferase
MIVPPEVTHIQDRRLKRMERVLRQRLRWVSCAAEALYHRHNVSAVMRTCDSMGLHHVHVVGGPFIPSKGPARGSDKWLDIHRHRTASKAISAIKEAGFSLWVADIADDALPPEEVPLERPVCLWFGAELYGVSDEARRAADGVVCVPMHGFAQSLNVSVAAAITMRPIAERARREVGEPAFLSDDERQTIWERWLERE